jgi:hypothetical protein
MDRATKALVSYGFTPEADGALTKKNDRYVPVTGGFLRFFNGAPMCFSIHPDWAGIGGLDPVSKPECFEMVYPSSWVIQEYEAAAANRAQWAAEAAARKA